MNRKQTIFIFVVSAVVGLIIGLAVGMADKASATDEGLVDHLFSVIDKKQDRIDCLEDRVKDLKRELRLTKGAGNGASTVVVSGQNSCR
jgi:cell division protein FtsL